jgi:hypothetical protein
MYCWNCGHKNQDGNKFCGECGKKQLRPSDVAGEVSDASASPRQNLQDDDSKIVSSPSDDRGKPSPPKILITDPLVEYSPPKHINRTLARRATDKPPTPVSSTADHTVPEPIPSDFGLHPIQVEPPSSSRAPDVSPAHEAKVVSNPLINEPGTVRESIATKPQSIIPPKEAPRRPANRISGPSFLGLSNEPSSDSSYLLEDEDAEARSSSSWPGVLALTLLIVFGVLLVKQWSAIQYFATTYAQKAGLTSGSKTATNGNDAIHHPPAAVSASGAEISSTENIDNNGQKNASDSNKQLAGNKSGESSAKSSEDLQKPENDEINGRKSPDTKEPANKSSDASDVNTNTSKPSPAHDTDNAEAKKTYDNSQIQLAEKYLYGRGVTQDCGRAMNLLQSSASQQNPNAQIKLGALYATGQCVQQDRAQAYGWYSKAKRLEPGNTWLDYSLNSLWASMSDDERRRAQSL